MNDGTYMGFVGVTTGHSSIMRVFPAWAEVLDLPTNTLIGHDVPLNAPPAVYADLVQRIADDPNHRGALVTTHKMAVYAAAKDRFAELDPLAGLFHEISSISKSQAGLIGAARDPITVRQSLEDFIPDDYFTSTGAAVLILGVGGSGSALSHQLGCRTDQPSTVICAARSQARIDELRDLHSRAGFAGDLFQYVIAPTAEEADELLTELPPGSLVVNATGMGKDVPGSPLSDDAQFPKDAIAWEFNYRGTLEFMHQAERQASRGVRVEDGWKYFVHGWAAVVADVFHLSLTPEIFDQLAESASIVR